MCAAAFLALSHPGVSTSSDDSHIEFLYSSSSLTSTISSQLPDPSNPLSDHLMIPSFGGVNYTVPEFHSCQTIPNESSSSTVFKRRLYYDSANAAHRQSIVQNSNLAPTLPVVGVS